MKPQRTLQLQRGARRASSGAPALKAVQEERGGAQLGAHVPARTHPVPLGWCRSGPDPGSLRHHRKSSGEPPGPPGPRRDLRATPAHLEGRNPFWSPTCAGTLGYFPSLPPPPHRPAPLGPHPPRRFGLPRRVPCLLPPLTPAPGPFRTSRTAFAAPLRPPPRPGRDLHSRSGCTWPRRGCAGAAWLPPTGTASPSAA